MPSPLENDIHVKVDHAIEGFLKNLSQIGPELLSVRACAVVVHAMMNGSMTSCFSEICVLVE